MQKLSEIILTAFKEIFDGMMRSRMTESNSIFKEKKKTW